MNRRLILLASMLFAAATFAFAPSASAEVDSCCVRIHNETAQCHAIICVRLPGGTFRCVDILATVDSTFRFPCDDSTHFTVTDVCGVPHRLILDHRILVPLRGGCCAHVILRRINGCYDILIDESNQECSCGGLE